jgi:hypothetical protein
MFHHKPASRWPWFTACLLLALPIPGTGVPVESFASDRYPAGPGVVLRQIRGIRNWIKHPAVVELDTEEDVFAVGDVHGDYDRLVTLLAAGKVIDPDPASPERAGWAAGKAVLVCTGDLIDKGPHSLKVIR